MTIALQTLSISHATAAAQSGYPIPFAYWGEDDLAVTLTTNGVSSALTPGSDYTLDPPDLSHTGGLITLLLTPPEGGLLSIRRQTRAIQGFTTPSTARGYEHALDRSMMCVQELRRDLTAAEAAIAAQAVQIAALQAETAALRADMARTLRTPEPIPELPAATLRTGYALTFDSAGAPRLVPWAWLNPFILLATAAPLPTEAANILTAPPLPSENADICAAPRLPLSAGGPIVLCPCCGASS